MANKPILRTARMTIEPMDEAALEAKAAAQTDPEMQKAYLEMLRGLRAHPQDALWWAPWELRGRGGKAPAAVLGDMGFKGAPESGAVELGYGLEEPHRGRGYATEAAKALADWAFSQEGVYFIEAEAEADNAASLRVLEKLGFKPDGMGAEGPRFVLERPRMVLGSLCMCVGLCIGMSLGMVLGGTTTGLCIGMSVGMTLGLCTGTLLDSRDKKKRAALEAGRAARRSAAGGDAPSCEDEKTDKDAGDAPRGGEMA